MLLKRFCWVFTLFILASASLHAGPTKEAGKELFMANCASCHNKNMKDKLTGPPLGGFEDRWSAYPRTDLYAWVRNSQALIATGHPYANQIWAENKPALMNNFPGLTDEQIESIVLFINAPPPTPPNGSGPKSAAAKEEGLPWTFISLAGVLLLLAFALMRIVNNLSNVSRAKDGLPQVERTMYQLLTTKGAIAFLVFGTILIFGYKAVDNATKMGREQNYKPDQPINFSHKIHAGINKIDCQYCHDTARRSKPSGIPGANTCMNCHTAVKKGTNTGTSEITKIFASIGYEPVTGKYLDGYENWTEAQIEGIYKNWIGQEYLADNNLTALDENGKSVVNTQWESIANALKNDSNGKIQGPIEWTRIHNLPDHAYFNHSQHVTIGKVECQKCHGKVEEMDVVSQVSTLGMGWCISCHRETEVKFKDNDYYKQYERYHDELKSGKRKKVTVEDIGGLECNKCHY